MGTLNYIARRLLFSVCLVLGVSVILFGMINAIGNPIEILLAECPGIANEIIEAVSKYYGLDGSVTDRYFTWAWAILRLDFGTSIIYNQPVRDMLLRSCTRNDLGWSGRLRDIDRAGGLGCPSWGDVSRQPSECH